MNKLVVGLTGILGCGKSTVARFLAERGAHIVDMDEAGRWAVDFDAHVQKNIRRTFGDAVFDQQGKLRRKELGDIVFRHTESLVQLNSIVHPAMLERVRSLIHKEKNEGTSHYIVVDAALIFELNFDKECDVTVCVTAPLASCLARATSKGLTEQQAMDRIHSQLPQEEKAARSDYVIRNETSMDDLQKNVHQLHDWLLTQL